MKTKNYKRMVIKELESTISTYNWNIDQHKQYDIVFRANNHNLTYAIIANCRAAIVLLQSIPASQFTKLRSLVVSDKMFIEAIMSLYRYVNFDNATFDIERMKRDKRLLVDDYAKIFI